MIIITIGVKISIQFFAQIRMKIGHRLKNTIKYEMDLTTLSTCGTLGVIKIFSHRQSKLSVHEYLIV